MSDRALRSGVLLLVLLSLGAGWLTDRAARAREGEAFPGFLMYPNGFVAPSFLLPDPAALQDVGLGTLDLVVAVNGVPVGSAAEIRAQTRALPPGAHVAYTFRRPWGSTFEATLPTRILAATDLGMLRLAFPLFGLALILVGTLPVLFRPRLRTAWTFFGFAWAEGTNFGLLPLDYLLVHRFTPWSYAIGTFAIGALVTLAATFPERRWPFRRHPRGAPVALYGLLAGLIAIYIPIYLTVPAATYPLALLALFGHVVGVTFLTVNCAWTALRSPDAIARQRGRVILSAPLLAVAATLVAVATLGVAGLDIPAAVFLLSLWVLPIGIAYAIYQHNLFEFDAVVRRGLTTGALVLLGALAYVGLFALLGRFVAVETAWGAAGLAVVVVLALVPAVQPLRERVERGVEAVLFPQQRAAAAVVREASRELVRIRDGAGVARLLHEAITRSVHSDGVRLVVGPVEGELTEVGATGEAGLTLGPADPIAIALRQGEVVNLDGREAEGTRAGRTLEKRLVELAVRLLVPLPEGGERVGGFLLGARRDGRLYTGEDERLLETLAGPAAVALENARAWDAVQALQRRLAQENVYLKQEIALQHGFEEIIGESPGIKAVLAQVEQVAPSEASVLVTGETGTGKEGVVRALHRLSRRSDRPLVKVACAAIPETLLESELFGHERGAFTGASARQVGRFEVADGGTLFFDDVDTLPLGVQAKLLRALQEGEVQRLGSTTVRQVDVRVVAATNRDLLEEVRAGRFREDLYYRLNVVPIRVPALRERREDIRLLVQHFVERESAKLGQGGRPLAPGSLEALEGYAWPGNVRELRNLIERAVVMSPGDTLRIPDLPDTVEPPGPRVAADEALLDGRPLSELLREFKIERITQALEETDGNQSRAAELLGLHRQSLSRMLRDLDIRPLREI